MGFDILWSTFFTTSIKSSLNFLIASGVIHFIFNFQIKFMYEEYASWSYTLNTFHLSLILKKGMSLNFPCKSKRPHRNKLTIISFMMAFSRLIRDGCRNKRLSCTLLTLLVFYIHIQKDITVSESNVLYLFVCWLQVHLFWLQNIILGLIIFEESSNESYINLIILLIWIIILRFIE